MKTHKNTNALQTVMVHDYAGHPFTAELSRELARSGYIVHHVFFAGDKGPKGRNLRESDDPDLLTFHPVGIDRDYSKKTPFARRSCDIEYGNKIATLVEDVEPDIVLSGNTPTETQSYLCAGRPIVPATPADNLAETIVSETEAGSISEPQDIYAFVRSVYSYLDSPTDKRISGMAGRSYAERTFQIEKFSNAFRSVFSEVSDQDEKASFHI